MTTPSNVSVVVVVHDMARELRRTLRSLSAERQHGIEPEQLEVIVVDNGSAAELEAGLLDEVRGTVRTLRIDPAPASPVKAANAGIDLATGDLIGLVIDGARLASPGLVAMARLASRLADEPVITAPAWHLGPATHMRAAEIGYDQVAEDDLLRDSGWEHDGYRLFAVSTPAGSSSRGLFGPMGESSSLFLRRCTWERLGGLDERFDLPGGGLANHDLYRRACALDEVELIVLVGEGTFHQHHGGAATSGRLTWDEMHAQYEAIRGVPYEPPPNPPLFVGTVPDEALAYVEESARLARARMGGTTPSG